MIFDILCAAGECVIGESYNSQQSRLRMLYSAWGKKTGNPHEISFKEWCAVRQEKKEQ